MEVEIVSRKLVAPSSPTPHHLRTFKLSAVDQAQLHFVYPTLITTYQLSNNDHSVNRQLEKSLSEILTLYYHMAGRFLDQDKSIITCNDQGVEFVEAKVVNGVKIAQLQSILDAKQLNMLVPELLPNEWPPLLVQVTVFECGGVAIGVKFSHKVVDGHSIAMFMNGWAKASRLGLSQVVPPGLECLPSLLPFGDDAFRVRPSGTPKKKGGGVFDAKRFVFNKAAIQSLKDEIGKDEERRKVPSRVVAVIAFIWRSLIRVTQTKHGFLRPSSLCIPVNMRGKTSLPIPSHSFGNFVTHTFARFMPKASRGVGVTEPPELQELVALLEDAVEKTVARCAKQQDGDNIFTEIVGYFREIEEELGRDGVDMYWSLSWCRFPFGEIDFGWGKTTWVSSTGASTPMIILIDDVDGDGIEALISLQEDEILMLQRDPRFLALNKEHHA